LPIRAALLLGFITPAMAGPPYLSDDPEPTDYRHFEIYTFSNGTATRDGTTGEGGIDFNYGGAPNLQLTATLPAAYGFPVAGATMGGLGNVELAAKYRFLTQDSVGLDVGVFPRVFLPSASSNIGEQHASLLLPIWMQKDWGQWSAFGGGGCEINQGGGSQNFCLMGMVVTGRLPPHCKSDWRFSTRPPTCAAAKPRHPSAPACATTSMSTFSLGLSGTRYSEHRRNRSVQLVYVRSLHVLTGFFTRQLLLGRARGHIRLGRVRLGPPWPTLVRVADKRRTPLHVR
jgi:hypothetical protein